VVASGIFGLPWDVRLSTFITYGSGLPYTITDASLGFGPNQLKVLRNEGRAESYQSFDFRLEKTVALGGPQRVGLVAEVFNAFNHDNYADYNGFIPPLPEVNANFGKPGRLTEPGRRFQFGVNYSFRDRGRPPLRGAPDFVCAQHEHWSGGESPLVSRPSRAKRTATAEG
jgi:hypothetical protein